MPHRLSPSADTGGAAETPLKADLDGRDHYERALGYIRDDGFATSAHWIEEHVASLRARLAESETKAAAMRDAIREYDYIRRECPNREERVASWNAVAASAALTREPTP